MKKLVVAICFIACCSAFAQGEKPCRVYEFGELNTYSDAELNKLYANYSEILDSIKSNGMPSNARDLREYFEDTQNCSQEKERLLRLIESRKKISQETDAKKAEAKKGKKVN